MAKVPHVEVHSSVGAPPAPLVVIALTEANSGGRTSAGLMPTPVMAGHTKGAWSTSTTPASTAMEPLPIAAASDASVAIVQVTRTTAGVGVPVVTDTGVDVPVQGSPLLSAPDRVTDVAAPRQDPARDELD